MRFVLSDINIDSPTDISIRVEFYFSSMYQSHLLIVDRKIHNTQRAHTCTENVLKTRFQGIQNVSSEDVHIRPKIKRLED